MRLLKEMLKLPDSPGLNEDGFNVYVIIPPGKNALNGVPCFVVNILYTSREEQVHFIGKNIESIEGAWNKVISALISHLKKNGTVK